MLLQILHWWFLYLFLRRNGTTSVSSWAVRMNLKSLSLLVIWKFQICIFSNMAASGTIVRLPLEADFYTMFPFVFMFYKHSSRKSNLSSMTCEFCFRTMLYILFNNSFTPCISRLAFKNWKPCSASSVEIDGGAGGLSECLS